MRKEFHSAFIIVLLIGINVALMLQTRCELRERDQLNRGLQTENQELLHQLRTSQTAWALSFSDKPAIPGDQHWPEKGTSSTFAVRLSSSQCSSCVDYFLVQLNKQMHKLGDASIVVLYSAPDFENARMGFRDKLLKNATFIRIPEEEEVCALDALHLPYLLCIDRQGKIQSTYLPYPVTAEAIETYIKHQIDSTTER